MANRSRALKKRGRGRTAEDVAPPGLRDRLVSGRLELLALFRGLDRLDLEQDTPPDLRELFELDADLAEALWALDQPAKRFDMNRMLEDTLASLGILPQALHAYLERLGTATCRRLGPCVTEVRASLVLEDAYLQIPGRDPTAS